MSGLDLVTPPTSEPLSLNDIKAHLHEFDSDQDELVKSYIASARSSAEAFLKMSLPATGWRYRIDGGFPREIVLPIGPVLDAETVSVSYVDEAGQTQTLEPADYQISPGDTCRIRPAYGHRWPVTRPVYDAVTIEFTAGWDDAGKMPPSILQALRLIVGSAFAQRENIVVGASAVEIPVSARNLMMPFVRHD